MPRIYVDFNGMKQIAGNCKTISSNVESIRSDMQRTMRMLDWDVKYKSDINNTASQIMRKLEMYSQTLKSYQSFLNDAHDKYSKLDNEKADNFDKLDYSKNGLFSSKTFPFSTGYVPFKPQIIELKLQDLSNSKKILKVISGINKNISEYGKKEKANLISSVFSYISSLCGVTGVGKQSGADAVSSFMSLIKDSIGVETGIYKYYEKTLNPYDASRFGERFGKTMAGLSVVSAFTGAASEGFDTYRVFSDSNSTIWNKTAQSIRMGNAVVDLGGKTYNAMQATSKTLRFVEEKASRKAVNQILTTESKLKYTTSAAATQKISNVNTALAITDVVTSSFAGGLDRFSDVSADGIDGRDIGSIGIYGSLSGLNSVSSSLTFGLVNFDSKEVAADLENDIDNFMRSDNWAANYIKEDKHNFFNTIGRASVSMGVGACILAENTVEGVANTVEGIANTVGGIADTVKNGISSAYKTVAGWFNW